jgi:DnaK suppressor protein
MKSNTLRQRFERELRGLLDRSQRIEGHLHEPIPPDSEDAAQRLENDEVLEGLDERTREAVAATRRAIARVDAGIYGTCSVCGSAIDTRRMEVLPTTTTCRGCAGR